MGLAEKGNKATPYARSERDGSGLGNTRSSLSDMRTQWKRPNARGKEQLKAYGYQTSPGLPSIFFITSVLCMFSSNPPVAGSGPRPVITAA